MKWSASAFAVVLALAFTAVLTSRSTGRSDDDHGRDRDRDSRIKIGYLINPVHLNLEGKNRALVGLGSYIVNAQAGCNDCHSCPSFAPSHNPIWDNQNNSMPRTFWRAEYRSDRLRRAV
jgi:hypothetical protein